MKSILASGLVLFLTNCTLKTNIKDLVEPESLPLITISDVSINEGSTALYTVSLSKPAISRVIILFQSVAQTATSGVDFTGLLGTLTIEAGQSFGYLPLDAPDDFIYEGNETFKIELSAAANAIMSAGVMSKTVTIVDNENKPKIFISDATVGEGGTLLFTVTTDVAAEGVVEFNYATVAGLNADPLLNATSNTDYTLISGRFTLASLAMSTSLSVISLQDLLNENDELFNVTLTSLTNVDPGDVSGLGTITDDDAAPVLSVSDLSINEGDTGSLVVSLSAISGLPVVFNLATSNGSNVDPNLNAQQPSDYTAVTLTSVTIPAGGTQYTVNIVTTEDLIDEQDEGFFSTVSGVTNASVGQLISNVTILDDDGPPLLYVSDASAVEGGSLAFTVSLTAPSGLAVTFNFQSYDGTALLADADYTTLSGSSSLAAGSVSTILYLATTADTKYETNETLTLSLSSIVNAGVGDDIATGTITNDDTAPVLSVADISFNEGDTGTFVATLSAVSGINVVFTYVTANGVNGNPLLNAQSPADFTALSSTTVTILAGNTFLNIDVASVEDLINENSEEFQFNVSGVTGATPASINAKGTILDDDVAPQLYVDDINIGEGATGNFTISLSAVSGLDVVFTYATNNGSNANPLLNASAPGDYTALTSTLVTIPAGSLTFTVQAITTEDLINESSEEFTLNISGPSNATIADSTGVATIIDNDGPPQILIGDAVIGEGGTLQFFITLTAASGLDVSFDLITNDVLATTAESDYTGLASRRVTIPAGSISFTQDVVTLQDILDEDNETLTVDLSNASNGVILDAQGLGTINDDDALPNLYITDATIGEGGTLTFTVSIDALSGRDVSFSRISNDGVNGDATYNAISPADYTAIAASVLTIAKGSLSTTINVVTVQDNIFERDEKMQIDLSSVTNASAADALGVGTITNDESAPFLYVSDVAVNEGETLGFIVSISGLSGLDVTFSFRTFDNTAVQATDYTNVNLSNITLPTGSLSLLINVVSTEDLINEVTENFTVSLSSVTTAQVNSVGVDDVGVGTITDNDGVPDLFVSDAASVTEGQTTTWTVSLSSISSLDVVFNFATADDTAFSTQDYTAKTGVATILAGQLTTQILVVTSDDVRDEVNTEYYFLNISAPTNASISDSQGTAGIDDNDNAPNIYIVDATTTEGTTFGFIVSITALSDLNVDFNYQSFNGLTSPAAAGLDYTAINSSGQIASGALSRTISLITLEDNIDELDENLLVSLSSVVNATVLVAGDDLADGIIQDNDLSPTLYITSATVSEGDTADLTISLSHPSSQNVTVEWATVNNTATEPSDYTQITTTLITITAGSLSVPIQIVTTEDLVQEPSESFYAQLSNATNADIQGSPNDKSTITITDDDVPSQLFISDAASVSEGQTSLFTISLNQISGFDVTFNYQSVDGTAVSTQDYTSVNQVGTILAGQLSIVVSVVTTDDVLDEVSPENYTITLTAPTNALISDGIGLGTINDNDNPPLLFVSNASTVEGGTLQFAVTLSEISDLDITFTYSTLDGTGTDKAVQPADYTQVVTSLRTIPAGSLSLALEVVTVQDTLYEVTEQLNITLASLTNVSMGDDGLGDGTITNDDAVPQLSIYDLSIIEGETGQFAVSISALSSLDTVFEWQTYYATAGASDFTAVTTTTVTIAALSSSVLLPVITTEDAINESTETFQVSLANATNATFLDALGVGTITDDDGLPLLYVTDASAVTEGQTSFFTVTLSAVSGLDVTFTYETLDNTADLTQDYTQVSAASGTILAGSLAITIPVVTIDDTRDEVSPEYFDLSISAPSNALIGDNIGTAPINDNDNPPALYIADATVLEGGTLQFIVSLSALSDLQVDFNYLTEDGLGSDKAQAPADYTAITSTAGQIPAGSLSMLISVVTAQETLYEQAEKMTVTLSSLVNAAAGDLIADGTITNDDTAPNIFIGDSTVTEGGTAVFAVTISAVSSLDSIFSWETTANNATSGSDYTAVSTTVATIPAGSLTTSVSVVTIDDVIAAEPTETFNVTLTNLTNIGAGDTSGLGTIDDNDTALLYIVDTSVAEGGTLVFAVSLSTTTGVDVTFNFQTVDGTATTADSDYTASVLTAMTIPSGSLTSGISVVSTPDLKYENDENLTVTLTGVVNANFGDASGLGTITNNDTVPDLFISDATVTEGATAQFTISLSAISGLPVSVQWFTADGTATTADSDYTSVSVTTVTIAAGSLTVGASVVTIQDTKYEANETYDVSLQTVTGANLVDNTGVGTITNDDASPNIFIGDSTVTEGGTAVFAVTISSLSSYDSIFSWETTANNATSGSDYTAVSTTVATIPAGSLTTSVSVVTIDDVIAAEPTETFNVTLTSLTNIGAGDISGLGTINDNDTALLYIVDASVAEGGTLVFAVSISALSGSDITFNFQTVDGTATTADSDYTARALTAMTIPAGSLTSSISVVSTPDTAIEADETLNVTLTSLVGVSSGIVNGVGTITNNDVPNLYISDAEVVEGFTMQFVVSITATNVVDVTFSYQSYDGDNTQVGGAAATTAGSDYAAISGTGTIAAGALAVTIPLITTVDTNYENLENLSVTISSAANATIADTTGIGFIHNDDCPATGWCQQAYLKADNADASDLYGMVIALDQDLVAVGASNEDSNLSAITNGTGASLNNSSSNSGAVYIYRRNGATWVQEAYLKPANNITGNLFGSSVQLFNNTLVVGANHNSSLVTGVMNGTGVPSDNSIPNAGAIYIYQRTGTTWAQQAFVKPAVADAQDNFGDHTSLNENTLAVGVYAEDSNLQIITNGTGGSSDNSSTDSGAVYVFSRMGTTWVQEAYLKASNADAADNFGSSLAVNGNTLAVGATEEESNQLSITNGTGSSGNNSSIDSGAVYVYERTAGTWVQQAYIKSNNATASDNFGQAVALSADTLLVGAVNESSAQQGLTNGSGSSANNSWGNAGAAYIFGRSAGTWAQQAYLKPTVFGNSSILMGYSVSLNGDLAAVSALLESSNGSLVTNGPGGGSTNTSASTAGSVFLFRRTGLTWAQEAYVKASNSRSGSEFGVALGLQGDTLVVGSHYEDSNQRGLVNGAYASIDTSAANSGSGYIYYYKGSPQVIIQQASTQVDPASFLPISFSVDFGKKINSATFTTGDITQSGTATGITWSITNSGDDRNFTLQATAGSTGTYIPSINAGLVTDVDGNTNLASSPNFDNSVLYFTNSSLYISDVEAIEGATMQFVVSITATNVVPVTFSYQSYDGDGTQVGGYGATTANSDYTAIVGTGTIVAGALAVTIPLITTADVNVESLESLTVTISGAVNATILDTTGIGFIHNDDCPTTGWCQQAYLKAADPVANDYFGHSSSVSGDTILVGAWGEDSSLSGVINGTGGPSGVGASFSGAAYVFRRTGNTWVQEAALKAADPVANDSFGYNSSSVSGDTILMGACGEDSSLSGVINGTGGASGVGANNSGAAYVFKRTGSTWVQEAVLKAADPVANDQFGYSNSLSGDTIVVGSYQEGSSLSGVINGTGGPSGVGASQSGAAYVFRRTGNTWVQEAALKAADPVASDNFGYSISVSGDTIIVGARFEDSSLSGVFNGTGGPSGVGASSSGAAYVFRRTGNTWVQEAALKAADPVASDMFGYSISVSGDTIVVGAPGESSALSGVMNGTGDPSGVGASGSGAVYVFKRTGSTWVQEAALKAADPAANDQFGVSSSISGDTIVIGANQESSNISGVNNGTGGFANTLASASGAAYVFRRTGNTWVQDAALKAEDPVANDAFGFSSQVSGDTIVVGVFSESSALSGVINAPYGSLNTSASSSGAAYAFYYKGSPSVIIQQASTQVDPASSLPISFSVDFGKKINPATFTTGDITQSGTATGITWSITNSGNDRNFTLQATAGSTGTYIPSINAGLVTDVDGNTNLASSPNFDNSVLYFTNSSLLISDAEVIEGATMQFVVSITATNVVPVTFSYQSYDGTTAQVGGAAATTADSDYTAISGTGTIAVGALAVTIPLITTADTNYENLENLSVTISSATNATIADTTGIGFIHNDDCPTTGWCQQAYLKAADPVANDNFGGGTGVSGDTIVVGASGEDSSTSGVLNGTGGPLGTGASNSGAAYVFRRTGQTWVQEAALKAADPVANDKFGVSTGISGDTIVVGAYQEGSSTSGVLNGTGGPLGTGASNSGAAYVFRRTGQTWVQEAALKAADPVASDNFALFLSISDDTILVGAYQEDSSTSGVLNGTGGPLGTGAGGSGAAYVFRRTGQTWVQEAALKAADPVGGDMFGTTSSISGNTIVVGAPYESSSTSGVLNGTGGPLGTGASMSGAAYVFRRTGQTWVQEAALKAADPVASDSFGASSSISGDTIVVGANGEDSATSGVLNGTGGPLGTGASNSGAAYVFRRTGQTWVQEAALKASDPVVNDYYGGSLGISGDTIMIGAWAEDSNLSGVINAPYGSLSTSATDSGATYVYYYKGSPSVVIQQASTQVDPASSLPISFSVEFSKAINPATFTTGDITQSGTATGITWSITNSGDDRNFTLQATAGSSGTYIPSVAAGLVTDVDGNTSLTSSPNFDNSVLYYVNSSLYISDAEAVEGTTMQFVVSITAANVVPVTFAYQSYDGTSTGIGGMGALAASDYTAISGTGTIAAGALAVTIPLVTTADTTYENLENLSVTISSATNATILDTTGLGYIDNDDCPTTGWCQQAYLKAADPVVGDNFGISSAMSNDTIVIGAYAEDSNISGVWNGTGGFANTSAPNSGAVYVFKRTGATWVQEAALKAADPVTSDFFGKSVAIDNDTILVGANTEDSNISGVINGTGGPGNTLTSDSGAAYVFKRTGNTWVQEAALKAADPVDGDIFGSSGSISGDTIVVGAYSEDSSQSGVKNGTAGFANSLKPDSGAVYIYRRTGTTWVQEAAFKAADSALNDNFGTSSAISGDTIVVGAPYENSNFSGVLNGTGDTSGGSANSGAAYVFKRTGTTWVQEAYLKAANPTINDHFGTAVSISNDAILVTANGEDANVSGVMNGTGESANLGALGSGAAYVFKRSSNTWVQEAYLKAGGPIAGDDFGTSGSVQGDKIVIGAVNESSSQSLVSNGTGDSSDVATTTAGAAYVFKRTSNTWVQEAYLKASDAALNNYFGESSYISGDTIVIGSKGVDSNVSGVINGAWGSLNMSAVDSGAAYVYYYKGSPSVVIRQAVYQQDPTSSLPISFDVEFSHKIDPLTFTTGDITQTGSATSVSWTILNSGDDRTFRLEATAGSSGTFIPGIAAGLVTDIDGATNLASSTSGDNSVTYSAPGARNVFIYDAAALEGGTLIFKVSLDSAAGSDITFNYSTVNGDALGGVDYESRSNLYTVIATGQTTVAIAVPTIQDTLSEDNELFYVSLTSLSTNAVFVDNVGVGVINEDDVPPEISVSDAAAVEGGSMQFTVRLEQYYGSNITVTFSTMSNTAVSTGTSADTKDYNPITGGVVTIPSGSLTVLAQVVTYVNPTGDAPYEDFLISLSGKSAGYFLDNVGIGTITDSATASGELFIGDAEAPEGQGMYFTVSLSGVIAANAIFTMQTYAGTATAGSDYTNFGPSVQTIPAGSLSILVGPVSTLTDGNYEGVEQFTATISAPTNATISDTTGVGYLLDIDCPATGWCQQAYLKSSDARASDQFGASAVDNDTLLVSAFGEASSQTGVTNGSTTSNDGMLSYAGRAYIFKRTGTNWQQVASFKAAQVDSYDYFGSPVLDGDTACVGASGDDSNQDFVTNGTGGSADGSITNVGAGYVFKRTGQTWVQEAYLKFMNGVTNDYATCRGLSNDTVLLSAKYDDSAQNYITSGTTAPSDTGLTDSGAMYVFKRTGNTWVQEAFIKAYDAAAGDEFANSADIDEDTMVVGAWQEDSNYTGIINGTQTSTNTGLTDSGAAYVYKRTGGSWEQEAYLKPGNNSVATSKGFGYAVSIHGDTIVVGARSEDSVTTAIVNGTGGAFDSSGGDSGAAYVFKRTGQTWIQQAYLKSANSQAGDYFGEQAVISGDVIAIGAMNEDSNDTLITSGVGASSDNSISNAGAVYVFRRTANTWVEEAFIKSSNSSIDDNFGESVALDGDTLSAGTRFEDADRKGIINGAYSTIINNNYTDAGANFVYYRKGSVSVVIRQTYGQADPTTTFPISFNVKFSKKIDPATFNTADITQSGTATGVNWVITNRGDDRNFTLQAVSSTTDGTIIPTIAGSTVVDVDGYANQASSPNFDNSVTKSP